MKSPGRILLVEDDESDLEFTLSVLSEFHPANEISIARPGAEAPDYRYKRGAHATCNNDNLLLARQW